ncbi:class I SAM-dependent methyltransferase [Halarcobacter sp.]|uniref:class I SAM-dependent methyltransferase n=1 Tax=Halarcobacter sp. TaxID=2321133 RepID=UPI002AA67097|nr:class I SAM-dependent methyltransferase [Halarcobacter sp.]
MLETLESCINKNIETKTDEFKRLFHGRGDFYKDLNFLTVDSINNIFFASFYKENKDENQIIELLKNIAILNGYSTFIVQRRYDKNCFFKVVFGEVKEKKFLVENSLKYLINFKNQNIGIFPDMKIGREYIKDISKNKNVLNLFSYTCAFSVCAVTGGAKQVVNVDMSKGALSIGRENHHINSLDTKKVKFLPLNILKSWSRIKKFAPYDVIVIDPPSFQKGSFAATKDYEKIIRRLYELASDDCIVLSCLNAPELNCDFIKDLFIKNAPEFKYIKRLDNLDTFLSSDENKSLKNMIFKREING